MMKMKTIIHSLRRTVLLFLALLATAIEGYAFIFCTSSTCAIFSNPVMCNYETLNDNGPYDVTRLIDYLLSDNVNGFDMGAADTDGDGQISIGDVTKLIDTVLHQ